MGADGTRAGAVRRHRNLEGNLQSECVKWFRLQYPHEIIYHIPNGGSRNKIEAHNLKVQGTLAGIPDLFIAYPSGGYHGMYIEMKYGKEGRLSPLQSEMIASLRSKGYMVEVIRSFDEFYSSVKEYMNNERQRGNSQQDN